MKNLFKALSFGVPVRGFNFSMAQKFAECVTWGMWQLGDRLEKLNIRTYAPRAIFNFFQFFLNFFGYSY